MDSSDAGVTALPPVADLDDVQETDLEVEREDVDRITNPFDPEQIKIRTLPIVIGQMVSRIGHGEIDLTPTSRDSAGYGTSNAKAV